MAVDSHLQGTRSNKRLAIGLSLAFLIGITVSAGAQEVKAPGSTPPGAPLPRYVYNVVSADFAAAEGYPLLKSKFNLYDPVGPTTEQFDSNIQKMSELNIDTFRIEMAWGRAHSGFSTNTGVGGTSGKLEYDFASFDHLLKLLASQNVHLLASYGYTPQPLQDPALSQMFGPDQLKHKDTAPPKNVVGFRDSVVAFERHAREEGTPVGINEVWNEPDGTYAFYSGTPEQYNELYRATVLAVRKDNPNAYIAGPASDHHMLWSKSFIDFVGQNQLPLDFYTFHEYGSGELAVRQVDRATASINRYPGLNKTALSLDEWHDGECCTWCNDDVRSHHGGAPEMLHDFALLVAKPELASVSWAWWEDPKNRGNGCMGLLTADGHRKAVFNAWKLYARMPVDRRAVHLEGPLEAMASSSDHRSSLLIWNREAYDRRLDVRLDHLPFAKGTVRIYRVDSKHASPTDGGTETVEVLETYPTTGPNWAWVDGAVPRSGILYFEAADDLPDPLAQPSQVAKVLRINRYYPSRGKTASYADFDRKTWIARLGMEGEKLADQKVGVRAADLPDELSVSTHVDGRLQATSANSQFGLRVDYMVDGSFVKSILFHGPVKGADLCCATRSASMPFGTEKPAQATRKVPDFTQFELPLKANAPANWSGTADITFIMQDAGPSARAIVMLRQAK